MACANSEKRINRPAATLFYHSEAVRPMRHLFLAETTVTTFVDDRRVLGVDRPSMSSTSRSVRLFCFGMVALDQ